MVVITKSQQAALPYDLEAEVAAFSLLMQAHALTEGVPAPQTYPLVETIVKSHGGQYRVIPDPPRIFVKQDMLLRLRDDREAWALRCAVNSFGPRLKLIYDSMLSCDEEHELFRALREQFCRRLGSDRAAELMEPRR